LLLLLLLLIIIFKRGYTSRVARELGVLAFLLKSYLVLTFLKNL
jgi:hypothetical protein